MIFCSRVSQINGPANYNIYYTWWTSPLKERLEVFSFGLVCLCWFQFVSQSTKMCTALCHSKQYNYDYTNFTLATCRSLNNSTVRIGRSTKFVWLHFCYREMHGSESVDSWIRIDEAVPAWRVTKQDTAVLLLPRTVFSRRSNYDMCP